MKITKYAPLIIILMVVFTIIAVFINHSYQYHKVISRTSSHLSQTVIDSFGDNYLDITPEYFDKRNKDISNNKTVNYSKFNEVETGMKLKKVLKIMEKEPNETYTILNDIDNYVWYSSSDKNTNYNIYLRDGKVVYKKQTSVDEYTTIEPSLDYSGITSSSSKTLEQINEEISETQEKLNQLLNK